MKKSLLLRHWKSDERKVINIDQQVHPLLPVYDQNTKILILGSFPSVKSREAGFYYMNPHNRFYQVLSVLLNENFVDARVEEKVNLLRKHHIGLFDIIKECRITGSSDASITDVVPNDLEQIISTSQIKRIFLNGNLAYKLFCKYFPKYQDIATPLPSTSPANAKMKLSDLREKWSIILKSL